MKTLLSPGHWALVNGSRSSVDPTRINAATRYVARAMMADGFITRAASLGSPGVDEVRWLSPLRPGDDLTLEVDVLEARTSKSRPELGIVKFKCTVRNAKDEALCEM